MLEESAHQLGIQIFNFHVAGLAPVMFGSKFEQQPECIPVTGDGVRAGPQLPLQSVGEEPLQVSSQVWSAHRRSPCFEVSWNSVASSSSSGTAWMYQYVHPTDECPKYVASFGT